MGEAKFNVSGLVRVKSLLEKRKIIQKQYINSKYEGLYDVFMK